MSSTDANSGFAVPKKNDRLFRGDLRDWMNNACLNVTGNGDPYAYKAGYRRGAEILIEHVCEHGRDQDVLVYPIIFSLSAPCRVNAEADHKTGSLCDRWSSEQEAERTSWEAPIGFIVGGLE